MTMGKIKRRILICLLVLSPFLFIFGTIGGSLAWLNPVNSFRHSTGVIVFEYFGCPHAGTCSFVAELENGKHVDVSQRFQQERLKKGDVVCVKTPVRKRIEWEQSVLVDMSECSNL